MARNKLIIALAGTLVVLIGAVALVVTGAALVTAKSPIVSKLGARAVNVYQKLSRRPRERSETPPPPAQEPSEIETTLLQLAMDKAIDVPKPARGVGGGLASFGDELVLLTNDGTIYTVKDAALVKAEVRAPDNSFESYKNASLALEKQGYKFWLDVLRYNDISVFRGRDRTYLLTSYIEWVEAQQCYRNALARLTIPEGVTSLRDLRASASDWTVIARTEPCLPIKKTFRAMEGHMSGGRMTQLDASTIALTSGDFHWDGVYGPLNPDPNSAVPLSQDPGAEYGKVLLVNVENGEKKILSSGNRNMQGIATTLDGSLWTVEHGPRGGDELNRQIAGSNYGWPRVTFGTQYSRLPWPGAVPYGRHDGYTPPAFAWVPSVAISGLARIDGFNEAWNGDLLASSLMEQALFRIKVMNGHSVYSERIPIGHRIRHVHQHSGGKIVLWTDSYKLIFLSAKSSNLAYDFARNVIEKSALDDAKKTAIKSNLTACLECHSLQFGSNDKAPSLAGIWNRRIGSGGFKGYSDALMHQKGVWNEETLSAFLSNPGAFASGTIMPNPNIDDPEIVKELVNVLKALNTTVD